MGSSLVNEDITIPCFVFWYQTHCQNNAQNAFQCSKTVSEYNTDMTQWSHKKCTPIFLAAIIAHRTPI